MRPLDLTADNIADYLAEQSENKDMLRFITCGSVDDGKSTLIGRLLYRIQADLRRPAGRP
jgi:GTPase